MRVIVIGGGIMGLSTALALCRKGHRVTIFEQHSIPNPMGSSVDQHRLIRHPYGEMGGYARLIGPAMAAWERLWADLGRSYFYKTGTLILARENLKWAESSLSDMGALGIDHAILSPDQLALRAPMLKPDGVELAAWVNSGGALLAREIVGAMARNLVLMGAAVHTHTPVIDIDTVRAAVTLEDGSRVRADRLVVAAGPWVRDICSSAQGRVKPSRQLVLYLKPPDIYAEAWKTAPMILDIHGDGGIYAVPPVASKGLKIGDHSFSLKGHPSTNTVAKESEISALFEACRQRLDRLDDYEIESGEICFYTVEKNERFILEALDKTVLLTGFSGHGFKFGALMGAMASGVLTGTLTPDDAKALAAGSVLDSAEVQRLTSLCLD